LDVVIKSYKAHYGLITPDVGNEIPVNPQLNTEQLMDQTINLLAAGGAETPAQGINSPTEDNVDPQQQVNVDDAPVMRRYNTTFSQSFWDSVSNLADVWDQDDSTDSSDIDIS